MPEATRLGPVRLQVAGLERSLAFYEEVLGLRRLEHEGTRAVLGSQLPATPPISADGTATAARAVTAPAPGPASLPGPALVELHEASGARPAPRRARTGLFHFAILLPGRPSLGRFARHVAELDIPLGSADHLVSESFYLHDPDQLGIEVYVDRPRGYWQRIGRELVMATEPLDLANLGAAAGDEPWTGMPAGTVMGHLHLHVGDLAAASAFYSEALGFDRTVWNYPGALFLGAGGYHHHLGTNVWAGPGATAPADDEAQLLEWTVELPDPDSLAAAAESLERAGHAVDRRREPGAGVETEVDIRDPWGTRARLRVAAAAEEPR